MHVQFLVAAHRDPSQVWRLCERLLDAPGSRVIVQWDCASPIPDVPPSLDVQLLVTRAPCEWGSGRQLDALLDSLHALEHEDFDWLVVLSGQDYPIRPMCDLVAQLEETPYAAFLQTPEGGFVPEPTSTRAPLSYLQQRNFYRYHWVPQRWWSKLRPGAQRVLSAGLQRSIRAVTRERTVRVQRRPRGFSPAVGVRARWHPFGPDRPCRKGSDWFALSRPVFDDLLAAVSASPEVVEHFRHTYLPTESFFHTLLLPCWESANAGANLHYRRFEPGRAHPEILGERDWGDFVRSGAFFARKFDPLDTVLLDRIDVELLGRVSR